MGKRAGCFGRGIRALGLALIPISYLLLTYAGWWTAPVASALIVLLARLVWPDRWAKGLGLRISLAQIGVSAALLCVVASASARLTPAIAKADGIAFTPVEESRAWPSLSLKSTALPCFPLRADLSTLLPIRRTGIHLTVRAAGLLSFLMGSHRFSTPGHPEARLAQQARCLLRGCLTIAATGLSSASRRQLPGHTSDVLGSLFRWQSRPKHGDPPHEPPIPSASSELRTVKVNNELQMSGLAYCFPSSR